jgi:methyltransferase (TIGR00027 family)
MVATWGAISGPGVTALGLAVARTVESGMPDGLIEDGCAPWFAAAASVELPMLSSWPTAEAVADLTTQQALHLHGSRYIGLRSRYYDDWLHAASAAGLRQVVILGAGLDARAFRLPWPHGTVLFELDQPGVLSFKQAVLDEQGAQPHCRRVPVGVDLREDWPRTLLEHGFDPEAATAWLAEGLLAYLPAHGEVELFDRIRTLSVPGARIAFDRIVGTPELGALAERSGVAMDELISTEDREDPAAALARHGWSVAEQTTAEIAARYGRDLGDPFAKPVAEGESAAQGQTATGHAAPPWLETVFATASGPEAGAGY